VDVIARGSRERRDNTHRPLRIGDPPGVEQRLADQMLIVGLATLHLWIDVVIELARLLLDWRNELTFN
jgi:hypothetical protein